MSHPGVREKGQVIGEETRGALLTLGLHQQLLESDQLSAMYTLSKGGGWRGQG